MALKGGSQRRTKKALCVVAISVAATVSVAALRSLAR